MSRQLWPTELRVREHSVNAWSLSIRMVARVGLEPTTFRVWTERSSQLSYLARDWSGWQDLNLRHLDPKSSALPSCATSRSFTERNILARPVGLEPATFWSVVKRSIQLSYGRKYISGGDGGIWTLTVLLPRDFKSLASTVPPHPHLEVPTRFEPVITELQSIALPLGYGTVSLTAYI